VKSSCVLVKPREPRVGTRLSRDADRAGQEPGPQRHVHLDHNRPGPRPGAGRRPVARAAPVVTSNSSVWSFWFSWSGPARAPAEDQPGAVGGGEAPGLLRGCIGSGGTAKCDLDGGGQGGRVGRRLGSGSGDHERPEVAEGEACDHDQDGRDGKGEGGRAALASRFAPLLRRGHGPHGPVRSRRIVAEASRRCPLRARPTTGRRVGGALTVTMARSPVLGPRWTRTPRPSPAPPRWSPGRSEGPPRPGAARRTAASMRSGRGETEASRAPSRAAWTTRSWSRSTIPA
jgi:hypothetical protein